MLLTALAVLVIAAIVVMYACNSFEEATDFLGRNMAPGVKGATLNAVGSSLPELLTTMFLLFAFRDVDGFSGGVATCAGSAVFNAIVIPALCILAVTVYGVKGPDGVRRTVPFIEIGRSTVLRDGLFFIAAEVLLIIFLGDTMLTWWMGGGLMLLYVAYVGWVLRAQQQHGTGDAPDDDEEVEDDEDKTTLKALLTLDFRQLFFRDAPFSDRNAWMVLGASVTVISTHSQNPEATFLFLQWLAEKRQQEELLKAGQGGVPIRQSSWALPVMQGGKLAGLFDPVVAADAALEPLEVLIDPGDLLGGPGGDLIEMVIAHLVQGGLQLRPHALDLAQVVRLAVARGRQARGLGAFAIGGGGGGRIGNSGLFGRGRDGGRGLCPAGRLGVGDPGLRRFGFFVRLAFGLLVSGPGRRGGRGGAGIGRAVGLCGSRGGRGGFRCGDGVGGTVGRAGQGRLVLLAEEHGQSEADDQGDDDAQDEGAKEAWQRDEKHDDAQHHRSNPAVPFAVISHVAVPLPFDYSS